MNYKVDFNKDSHTYYIDGVEYPSVTAIIDQLFHPALLYWAVKEAVNYIGDKLDKVISGELELDKISSVKLLEEAKKEHERIRDQAADVGSKTHKVIELFVKGEDWQSYLKDKDEIVEPFGAFLEWDEKNRLDVMYSEAVVCSKKYKYAGTLDIIGFLKDKLYIIDLKTSSAFREGYKMQLSAYRQAVDESGGVWVKNYNEYVFKPIPHKVQRMGILRLDKETGKPYFKEYDNKTYRRHLKMFLCLCKFYHLKKEG